MSLEDLGNIGEFVAAVGVIVSLIYLAVQIRQNTKTVRTSTYQEVLDYSNRFNELVLSNPQIGRIWRVGRKDPAQLTEDERSDFRFLVAHVLNIFETMFLQYQRGTLDKQYWNARLVGFRHQMSQPGMRAYWVRVRKEGITPARVPGFQELMDSLVDLPADQDGSDA
jgi:hypothetical protein